MQIDFATSGGVTNHELAYRADTDTLPEQEAEELVRLVESSGAFDLEQDQVLHEAATGAGNVTAYRLTLSDGNRETTLWLNDVTAPTAIRPLLSFLRERALEQRNTRT